MSGRRVGVKPNTPAWLAWRAHGVTATDVAAILGLSSYDSPFSLWWKKKVAREPGLVFADAAPQSKRFALGHAMEPVLERFFKAEQTPEGWRVGSGGCWQGKSNLAWCRATPDRLLYDAGPRTRTPVAVVEFKTDASNQFGEDPGDGVPEIPVIYRAQMLWQMMVVGVDVGWLTCLTSRMQVKHYRVLPQPGEIDMLHAAAREFHQSLAAGDPPDLDGHEQTLAAVRALYRGVDDSTVEIDGDLALDFAKAVERRKYATVFESEMKARLLDAMGEARAAWCDGQKIATRIETKRGVQLRPATAPRPKPQPITEEKIA